MRYAQRGGYTPAEQQRREQVGLQAAERFARGDVIKEIAHDLRVTEGSGARRRRLPDRDRPDHRTLVIVPSQLT